MRWLVFALFAYVALALDQGLRTLLAFDPGVGPVAPSFTLVLAVYVGLWAPSRAVAWAFLFLGAASDLLHVWPSVQAAAPNASGPALGAIMGPLAIGYLVGAYAVIQVRGLLYRESTFALAVVALGVGAAVHLVAMLLLTLRGLPLPLGEPVPGWRVADEFLRRFLEILYTAVLAVPVGMALQRAYRPGWLDTGHAYRR